MTFHAFDLTPEMVEIFRHRIQEQRLMNVQVIRSDILSLTSLPEAWTGYDPAVCSAVLEYIPGNSVTAALRNLKRLIKPDGLLLLILTRRTVLTGIVGKVWWKTNLFTEEHIRASLHEAGFQDVRFKPFSPGWSRYIMAVEARV